MESIKKEQVMSVPTAAIHNQIGEIRRCIAECDRQVADLSKKASLAKHLWEHADWKLTHIGFSVDEYSDLKSYRKEYEDAKAAIQENEKKKAEYESTMRQLGPVNN